MKPSQLASRQAASISSSVALGRACRISVSYTHLVDRDPLNQTLNEGGSQGASGQKLLLVFFQVLALFGLFLTDSRLVFINGKLFLGRLHLFFVSRFQNERCV